MRIVLTAVILGCVGLGIYLLYLNGYIPVQLTRAWVFIGSMGGGRKRCSASFQATTGTIQRIIRYKESKLVTFCFTGNITDGSVNAFVLDRNKQVLLTLNSASPTGKLQMEANQRYYLKIKFQQADGDYQIQWD